MRSSTARTPGTDQAARSAASRSAQAVTAPSSVIRWLIDAPSMDPGTAMPPMPLTQDQARDVAAYLYSLDDD